MTRELSRQTCEQEEAHYEHCLRHLWTHKRLPELQEDPWMHPGIAMFVDLSSRSLGAMTVVTTSEFEMETGGPGHRDGTGKTRDGDGDGGSEDDEIEMTEI